jgi:hypothetical protein
VRPRLGLLLGFEFRVRVRISVRVILSVRPRSRISVQCMVSFMLGLALG